MRKRWKVAVAGAVMVVAASGCVPPAPSPSPVPPENPLTRGSGGVLGNGPADSTSLSADGTVVAFVSSADNLVPGDTDGQPDVFVRDLGTGAVDLVADAPMADPRLSADGRYVAFHAGSALGVLDRQLDVTYQWGATVSGVSAPVVADGVAVYGALYDQLLLTQGACQVRTLATGVEKSCPLNPDSFGSAELLAASSNARFVVYRRPLPGGSAPTQAVLWDRSSGSVTVLAQQLNPYAGVSVSDDGRYVATALPTMAPMTPVVYDLVGQVDIPIPTQPVGAVINLGISPDGRYVGLLSAMDNFDPADTNGAPDVFLWDVQAGTVALASATIGAGASLPAGGLACSHSPGPGQVLSSGRMCVASVDPLLPTDTNAVRDSYLVP